MREKATRRIVLAGGFGVGLVSLGGWQIRSEEPLADLPAEVAEAEFDWSEETTEYAGPQWQREGTKSVHLDRTGDAVVLRGWLQYGSSSCDRIRVARIDSLDGGSELVVEVSSAEKDHGLFGTRTCTDDLAEGSYRLEMTLASESPEQLRVTATHAPETEMGSVTTEFEL